jgi:hypothetical protein
MSTGGSKQGKARLEAEATKLNHDAGYHAYHVVRVKGGYALQRRMNLDGTIQGRMF